MQFQIKSIMQKYKLAIIDDGIDKTFLKNNVVWKVVKDKAVVPYHSEKGLTHGTTVAYIIEKSCNIKSIISIKILNDQRELTSANKLIIALEWCLHEGIHIINLSLGSTNLFDRGKIKQIVLKLVKSGAILVAANSNSNNITYPASMKQVIGVSYDWNQELAVNQFAFVENSINGINILVNSDFQFSDFRIAECNSYSAPLVTSEVFRLYSQGITTYNEIISNLISGLCDNKILPPVRELESIGVKDWELPVVVFRLVVQEIDRTFLEKFVEQFFLLEYNCIVFNKKYNELSQNMFNYCFYQDKYQLETRELINQVLLKQKADIILFETTSNYENSILLNRKIDLFMNISSTEIEFQYNDNNFINQETIKLTQKNLNQSVKTIVKKIIRILT